MGGRAYTLPAFVDSGNLLTEPLTGLPVVLTEGIELPPGLPLSIEGQGVIEVVRGTVRTGDGEPVPVYVGPSPLPLMDFQALVPGAALHEGRKQNVQKAQSVFLSALRAAVHPALSGVSGPHGGEPAPAPVARGGAKLRPAVRTSEAARNRLIEHNLRLVVFIARKFENTGVLAEDLISIGTIGLIKAVNTFDPEKKIKLATYASRCIENEILMYLRRSCKLKLEVSLDEPLNVDWDGNELLLSDILGTDGEEVSRDLEDEVDRRLLWAALARLSPRERRIVEMRFGLGRKSPRTQKQVADAMGISQSYISRLEKRIMDHLKREITAHAGIDGLLQRKGGAWGRVGLDTLPFLWYS